MPGCLFQILGKRIGAYLRGCLLKGGALTNWTFNFGINECFTFLVHFALIIHGGMHSVMGGVSG